MDQLRSSFQYEQAYPQTPSFRGKTETGLRSDQPLYREAISIWMSLGAIKHISDDWYQISKEQLKANLIHLLYCYGDKESIPTPDDIQLHWYSRGIMEKVGDVRRNNISRSCAIIRTTELLYGNYNEFTELFKDVEKLLGIKSRLQAIVHNPFKSQEFLRVYRYVFDIFNPENPKAPCTIDESLCLPLTAVLWSAVNECSLIDLSILTSDNTAELVAMMCELKSTRWDNLWVPVAIRKSPPPAQQRPATPMPTPPETPLMHPIPNRNYQSNVGRGISTDYGRSNRSPPLQERETPMGNNSAWSGTNTSDWHTSASYPPARDVFVANSTPKTPVTTATTFVSPTQQGSEVKTEITTTVQQPIQQKPSPLTPPMTRESSSGKFRVPDGYDSASFSKPRREDPPPSLFANHAPTSNRSAAPILQQTGSLTAQVPKIIPPTNKTLGTIPAMMPEAKESQIEQLSKMLTIGACFNNEYANPTAYESADEFYVRTRDQLQLKFNIASYENVRDEFAACLLRHCFNDPRHFMGVTEMLLVKLNYALTNMISTAVFRKRTTSEWQRKIQSDYAVGLSDFVSIISTMRINIEKGDAIIEHQDPKHVRFLRIGAEKAGFDFEQLEMKFRALTQ